MPDHIIITLIMITVVVRVGMMEGATPHQVYNADTIGVVVIESHNVLTQDQSYHHGCITWKKMTTRQIVMMKSSHDRTGRLMLILILILLLAQLLSPVMCQVLNQVVVSHQVLCQLPRQTLVSHKVLCQDLNQVLVSHKVLCQVPS